jgi:hypothetical protein
MVSCSPGSQERESSKKRPAPVRQMVRTDWVDSRHQAAGNRQLAGSRQQSADSLEKAVSKVDYTSSSRQHQPTVGCREEAADSRQMVVYSRQ